jgi:hypothetical protein
MNTGSSAIYMINIIIFTKELKKKTTPHCIGGAGGRIGGKKKNSPVRTPD